MTYIMGNLLKVLHFLLWKYFLRTFVKIYIMARKSKKQKFKYSVLTFIFGDYEKLHEVGGEMEKDVEYVCVTDNPELKSDTWKIVIDKDLNGKGVFDKCFSVRYNPFKYCNSDICVRIDGSIGILKPITPLVDAFIESGCDACFLLHPYRDNLFEEYKVWGKYRNYPIKQIEKQILSLARIGYDSKKNGLIQLNFAINKRGKICDDINRITYAMLKYLGDENDLDRLDQTVITAILDRYFPDLKIFFVGEDITHSEYMQNFQHNSDNKMPYAESSILEPFFRGEKVDVFSFNEEIKG